MALFALCFTLALAFSRTFNVSQVGASSTNGFGRDAGIMHNLRYFDTHASQLTRQAALLQEFSEAVPEFIEYLRQYDASTNLIVMTTGDFGRTPWSNGSQGTDHGTSTFHFILGDSVNGGMYRPYADLTPERAETT
jgi:uncharacterized protein (DUF1501 family)